MECLIYNDIYRKSILDLVIVFRDKLLFTLKCIFFKWIINSIDIIEKFELFCKQIQRQFIKNFRTQCSTVIRRSKDFRERKDDVNDDPRSASPLFEFTGENIQLVRQVISNDLHSTYDEIIAGISLSLIVQ